MTVCLPTVLRCRGLRNGFAILATLKTLIDIDTDKDLLSLM